MTTKEIIDILNDILSDRRVLEDFYLVLSGEIARGGFSELSTGETLRDTPVEVINKKFIYMKYETGFGSHYVAKVAVSGIKSHGNGVLVSNNFFASLYYSEDLRLITVDFHD